MWGGIQAAVHGAEHACLSGREEGGVHTAAQTCVGEGGRGAGWRVRSAAQTCVRVWVDESVQECSARVMYTSVVQEWGRGGWGRGTGVKLVA